MAKYRAVLVEDDSIVIKELHDFFDELPDYEVVKAFTKSEKAYDWIHEHNAEFDILVTDIEMEGRDSGIVLARKANKPTIFISGKTEGHVKEIDDIDLNSDQLVMFLSKPATLEKLEKKLAKLVKESEFNCSALFSVKREGQRNVKSNIRFKDILFIRPINSGRNNKECFLAEGSMETLIGYTHNDLFDVLPEFIQPIGKGLFIAEKAVKELHNKEIILMDSLSELAGQNFVSISKEYWHSFKKINAND